MIEENNMRTGEAMEEITAHNVLLFACTEICKNQKKKIPDVTVINV